MNNRFLAIIQVALAFFLWSTLAIFFNIVQLPTAVYVVFGSLVGLCILYAYFYLRRGAIPKFTFSWELVGLFLVAGIKGIHEFRTSGIR